MYSIALLLYAAAIGQTSDLYELDLRVPPDGKQPLTWMRGTEPFATFDGEGLRLKLPADREGSVPAGLDVSVRLHGDFEATLTYELLATPDPTSERGAGVALIARFNVDPALAVSVTRMHKPNGETFGAN